MTEIKKCTTSERMVIRRLPVIDLNKAVDYYLAKARYYFPDAARHSDASEFATLGKMKRRSSWMESVMKSAAEDLAVEYLYGKIVNQFKIKDVTNNLVIMYKILHLYLLINGYDGKWIVKEIVDFVTFNNLDKIKHH